MTRAARLILLAVLVVYSLVEPGIAEDAALMVGFATPTLATPASNAMGEMPGAVPLSLLIQNHGHVADRLLGGSTPAADRVEMHTSQLDHGVRRMLTAPKGITIPADGTLILEPASHHLMLVGLRKNLTQGETFPLTLRFARAGEITVTVRVRRKVDAAGLPPIPSITAGDLTISLVSASPATAERGGEGEKRTGRWESANSQPPTATGR